MADKRNGLGKFRSVAVEATHEVRPIERLGTDIDVAQERLGAQVPILGVCLLEDTSSDVPVWSGYLIAAAQLVRRRRARIPYADGYQIELCSRGDWRHNLHVMGWEVLAHTVIEAPMSIAVITSDQVGGRKIDSPISNGTGTENAMLCARVATVRTTIYNPYATSETEDLIGLLCRMRADLEVTGTSVVAVRGKGVLFAVVYKDFVPEGIEAPTWIFYPLIGVGVIVVLGVLFRAIEVPLVDLDHRGLYEDVLYCSRRGSGRRRFGFCLEMGNVGG